MGPAARAHVPLSLTRRRLRRAVHAPWAALTGCLRACAGKINEILTELFDKINIILVDFKIELGKTADGKIILADEISPDTCRLWDKDTKKKLDKDRFRRDLGEVTEAYEEIYNRLNQVLNA